LVAFDIGDVGVDSASVGVIMTPVYVQVIRMKLEGMGTDHVAVKLEQTDLMPLVNIAAFEKLVRQKNVTRIFSAVNSSKMETMIHQRV
jgi:hypothetical protein